MTLSTEKDSDTLLDSAPKIFKKSIVLAIDRDFIVLTHGFVKRTGRVPQSEIDLSKKYRADFLARYDEQKLKEEFNEEF